MRKGKIDIDRILLDEEKIFDGHISKLNVFYDKSPQERDALLSKYPELKEIYNRFKIDKYLELKNRSDRIRECLKKRLAKPEKMKAFFNALHSSKQPLNDEILDDLLGIKKAEEAEKNLSNDEFYANEQFVYKGSPYEKIRKFLRRINLSEEDTVYDLGSGYGRVITYGSLTTPARWKGIEIVPERVEEVEKIKNRLHLDNLDIIKGNVLAQEFSDGTVFFLYNPFTQKTLRKVGLKLKEIAAKKKIKIASISYSSKFFQTQDWLQPLEQETERTPRDMRLTIFESK